MLRALALCIDVTMLVAAFFLAWALRFDFTFDRETFDSALFCMPYVVLIELGVMTAIGVRRFAWRYVGLREVQRIFLGTLLITAILVLWRIVAAEAAVQHDWFARWVIPYGVVLMNAALVFLSFSGVRVARRIWVERSKRELVREAPAVATMLVGAGVAGVNVVRELIARPDLGLRPVGFLDDDVAKHGSVVSGVPVVGSTQRLAQLCRARGATQVLITMPDAPGAVVRKITKACEEANLDVKIIPGLYEIVGGQVQLSRIRSVAIEDLLRREPIELEMDRIARDLHDRVVLVTGAGGSIGSEICRQVANFGPSKLVLVDQAENNLFHIHRELLASHPHVTLIPFVGNVTDSARMGTLFSTHRPFAVFHAAAHKHVPLMEENPGEAIKNNIQGTRIVADLAHRYHCDSFVFISTDKAVNPSSVMGASKRAAELVVQMVAARSQTRFVTVRFGNVLGSAGSVVPIFKEQIAAGGPVTITHPEMKRYFMTIPEACQLVLQAGSMGQGGEIFILDMGEPVRILDLARDLIELSGLRVGEDIQIEFTGMRPGEKLFEELATDGEHADKTRHPKIFVGRIPRPDDNALESGLQVLFAAVDGATAERLRSLIKRIVPEYVPGPTASSDPPPVPDPIAKRVSLTEASVP